MEYVPTPKIEYDDTQLLKMVFTKGAENTSKTQMQVNYAGGGATGGTGGSG